MILLTDAHFPDEYQFKGLKITPLEKAKIEDEAMHTNVDATVKALCNSETANIFFTLKSHIFIYNTGVTMV